ncbi:hypothetical protein Tco_0390092 [Tanacetum coccineum]
MKCRKEKHERKNENKRSVRTAINLLKKLASAVISEEPEKDENEYQLEADDIEIVCMKVDDDMLPMKVNNRNTLLLAMLFSQLVHLRCEFVALPVVYLLKESTGTRFSLFMATSVAMLRFLYNESGMKAAGAHESEDEQSVGLIKEDFDGSDVEKGRGYYPLVWFQGLGEGRCDCEAERNIKIRSRPAITFWTSDLMKDREDFEIENGSFGNVELIPFDDESFKEQSFQKDLQFVKDKIETRLFILRDEKNKLNKFIADSVLMFPEDIKIKELKGLFDDIFSQKKVDDPDCSRDLNVIGSGAADVNCENQGINDDVFENIEDPIAIETNHEYQVFEETDAAIPYKEDVVTEVSNLDDNLAGAQTRKRRGRPKKLPKKTQNDETRKTLGRPKKLSKQSQNEESSPAATVAQATTTSQCSPTAINHPSTNLRLPSKHKRLLEGVCYGLWWFIWAFRNKKIFGVVPSSKANIFDDLVLSSFFWCRYRYDSEDSIHEEDASINPNEVIKDVIKSVAETINYEDQDVEKTPVSSSDKKRGRPRKQSYLGNVKG